MKLPYRAETAMGERFDIEFPLHPETGSAVRVGQLLSSLLAAIDRDVGLAGETSNGDVLQALAMATAIRAGMVHAPPEVTAKLTAELIGEALGAVAEARRASPTAGHA